jgi:hypothetical protein
MVNVLYNKQINRNFTAGCFVPQHFKPAIKSHYLGVEAVEFLQNGKWRVIFMFIRPLKSNFLVGISSDFT